MNRTPDRYQLANEAAILRTNLLNRLAQARPGAHRARPTHRTHHAYILRLVQRATRRADRRYFAYLSTIGITFP